MTRPLCQSLAVSTKLNPKAQVLGELDRNQEKLAHL